MNLLAFMPSETDYASVIAVSKRLRELGHRVININPRFYKPPISYRGVAGVIVAQSGLDLCATALADYKESGAKAFIIMDGADPQQTVDAILGGQPTEVKATEGLPVAPPVVQNPSGILDGLPPVVGDDYDTSRGEGLITRQGGRRSRS